MYVPLTSIRFWAVCFGFVAGLLPLVSARQQRHVVHKIWGSGGYVLYEDQLDESLLLHRPIRNPQGKPQSDLLSNFLGRDIRYGVRAVILTRADLGHSELTAIESLPRLMLIDFNGSALPSNGLDHFDEMSQLKLLFLSNCNLDDHTLNSIANLRRLKVLYLNHNRITGHNLDKLADLHELEVLDLSFNPINDDHLSQLSRLESLKHLSLVGTEVSPQAVNELKRRLPRAHIYH